MPVSHPPYLGNISVEARATVVCLAEALEDVEIHYHDPRPSDHWSWMHCRLRLSAASRCCSFRAMLKAYLQVTERCRRITVALARTILP